MHIYFGHVWIVSGKDVDYMLDTVFANPMKLDYYMVTHTGLEEDLVNGYRPLYLVIRVPSEAALNEFVEKVGKQIGLVEWHSVPKEHFEMGVNPLFAFTPII